MEESRINRLQKYLSEVSDQRQEGKVKHRLESILFMAVAATIANAGSWEEIAQFAKGHEAWFRQYIDLPYGVPSHDTFERVFKWVDGKEFERTFVLWMHEICQEKELGIVAIDGKTMRGSEDKKGSRKALHIVSAWTSEANLVLGQVKTEEKSNEITAIPELLKLLELKGSIVTIDAIGTQKNIAEQIKQKKAEYVLSVKGNQPRLYEDLRYFMEEEGKNHFSEVEHEYCRTHEKGHGRIEKREYWLFRDVSWISWRKEWKGFKSIGMVKRSVSEDRKSVV